jgi:hypothetical protein
MLALDKQKIFGSSGTPTEWINLDNANLWRLFYYKPVLHSFYE